MATLKYATFDPEKIRMYIVGDTDVLERGIAYAKSVGAPDNMVAKETAIRLAQEICQRKWQNDSTGYINSEYKAYTEFSKDVKKGLYFNVTRHDPITDRPDWYRWFMFFICLILGPFGVHRFLDGRILTGFLWLCTGGMFLIGWIVDLVNIWRDEF